MSKDLVIYRDDQDAINRALQYVKQWCSEHQCELGLAEMALGASVLAYAVHTGAVEVGRQVVGSAASLFNGASLVGAGTGATFGGVAGALIGSIGVVPFGGIAISGLALAMGGSVLFGAMGYTVGDAVHKFLSPSFGDMLQGASLLTVGLALVYDGARRVIHDARVLRALGALRNGILRIGELTAEVVARSNAELKAYLGRHQGVVKKFATVGSLTAVATGMAGVGSLASGGMVSVLGSHALGATAVSLGLISAPVWPVIAGGVAGAGVCYAALRALRGLGSQSRG
jgi:hypothetical protein